MVYVTVSHSLQGFLLPVPSFLCWGLMRFRLGRCPCRDRRPCAWAHIPASLCDMVRLSRFPLAMADPYREKIPAPLSPDRLWEPIACQWLLFLVFRFDVTSSFGTATICRTRSFILGARSEGRLGIRLVESRWAGERIALRLLRDIDPSGQMKGDG